MWNFWPKELGSIQRKCQRWSPVLIKLQGNVSKIGLWHRIFFWNLSTFRAAILESTCEFSSRYLDAFLVFNGEALLYSLWNLPLTRERKSSYTETPPETGFIGNVPFKKSYTAAACNFTLRSCSRLLLCLLANLVSSRICHRGMS